MNFPTKPGGPKDKQFEFIAADVFLRRLIIDLHSTNLMVIALEADMFFWVAGEIACSCGFDTAMFRLFGDTDIGVAEGSAIGIGPGEKAEPHVCSRTDDACLHHCCSSAPR